MHSLKPVSYVLIRGMLKDVKCAHTHTQVLEMTKFIFEQKSEKICAQEVSIAWVFQRILWNLQPWTKYCRQIHEIK